VLIRRLRYHATLYNTWCSIDEPCAIQSSSLLYARFIECTYMSFPTQDASLKFHEFHGMLQWPNCSLQRPPGLITFSCFRAQYFPLPSSPHPPRRNIPIRLPFFLSTSLSVVVQFPSGPMKYSPSPLVFPPSPSRCIELTVEASAAPAMDDSVPCSAFSVMTLAELELAFGTI